MTKVLLDTNIYVDWLNQGRHAELLVGQGFVRYLSAAYRQLSGRLREVARAVDQGMHLMRELLAELRRRRILMPAIAELERFVIAARRPTPLSS